MARLTDIKIRNTHPSTQDVLLSDGNCLYLRVRPSGSKGWIVRIKRQGRRRVHTLGAWPAMSIKEARAEAARIVAVDRGDERVTVAEAVEQFMDLQIRPKYRRVDTPEVYCRVVTRSLGTLAVDRVRPVDISRMISAYSRTAPVAALRLLSFTKHLLSWCAGIGYLSRSPAADIKSGVFGVVEVKRERILTDAEVRNLWHATDLEHVPLLRFLLLTGLRIMEAKRATLANIDVDHWLTVPAQHSKNGKAHRVYLAPLARHQIEPHAAPLLFANVSCAAIQSGLHRWHDRHGVDERWTPHDLRRSFASRCGDLGVAPHVIAKLLNHTIPGGDSLPVYLRSEWLDERKQAAITLAAHVAKVLKKQESQQKDRPGGTG